MDNDFYNKALQLVAENDLSGALMWLMKIKHCKNSRKLIAVCLYGLGYTKAASKYSDNYNEAIEIYISHIEKISNLIELNSYKKAILSINNRPYKTVIDYCLMGCLYMLTGKTDKGKNSFINALSIDKYNRLAVYLLSCTDTKERNLFEKFIRNFRASSNS